jgi:aspartate dehydrogenase
MAETLRVGLIGFGAIGRAVAERLHRGEAGTARVCAVLVRRPERISPEERAHYGDVFCADLGRFLHARLDWAVEAAGHAALRQWGTAVLDGGVNLMALSAGALADDAFRDELERCAVKSGRRVLVPSGGMGALDLLSSAALDRLDAVRLTTRKPPGALLPPEEASAVMASGKARLLFDGTAREAAPRFPENLNICSALALAGIGLDRTRVRVYADPAVKRNTHRISARGATGSYQLTLRHVPSENPKTGRVVALSVVKALRNLTSPFLVGA